MARSIRRAVVEFDQDFMVHAFNSPRTIAEGHAVLPKPGDVFSVSVAAPGTGTITYRVNSVYRTGRGRSRMAMLCTYLESTVRDLTVADVI